MTTQITNTSFATVTSERSLGRNMPQKFGGKLVLPMFGMAMMAFLAGFVVSIFRAGEVSDAGNADTIEALRHFVAGLMFLGFATVFAGISFAIARILGEFRKGWGDTQEAAGGQVKTLQIPKTAKLFLGLMSMSMMTILGAVVLHFIFAADVSNTAGSLETSEQRFLVLEAVRRVGVGMYLFSILPGLATIAQVPRFQSVRIREVADSRKG